MRRRAGPMATLDQAERELEAAFARCGSIMERLAGWRRSEAVLLAKVGGLESAAKEAETLRTACERLRRELADCAARHDAVVGEANRRQGEQQAREQELRATAASMQKQLAAAGEETSRLKRELGQATTQRDTVQRELDSLRGEAERLRRDLALSQRAVEQLGAAIRSATGGLSDAVGKLGRAAS
jgi:chromosome segregation ATPase